MKKIFIFTILFTMLISLNTYAQQQKITCWGCKTSSYLDDITRYISNNDKESLKRYIIQGKCYLIDDYVYLVERGILTSKVDWDGEKWYVISECVK